MRSAQADKALGVATPARNGGQGHELV